MCKHWAHGRCKKGDTCKFLHTEASTEPPPKKAKGEEPPEPDGYNARGLPIRAGKADCAQYMRKGACPFLKRCKFNHPEWDPEQENVASLERAVKTLAVAQRIADEAKARASSQTAASSRGEQSALPPVETAEAAALLDAKSEAAWSASQKAEEEGTAEGTEGTADDHVETNCEDTTPEPAEPAVGAASSSAGAASSSAAVEQLRKQLQEKMAESKDAIQGTETLVAEENAIVEQLRKQVKEAKETIKQSLGIPVPPPPRQLRKKKKKRRKPTKPEEAEVEPAEQEEADEDSEECEDSKSPREKLREALVAALVVGPGRRLGSKPCPG